MFICIYYKHYIYGIKLPSIDKRYTHVVKTVLPETLKQLKKLLLVNKHKISFEPQKTNKKHMIMLLSSRFFFGSRRGKQHRFINHNHTPKTQKKKVKTKQQRKDTVVRTIFSS